MLVCRCCWRFIPSIVPLLMIKQGFNSQRGNRVEAHSAGVQSRGQRWKRKACSIQYVRVEWLEHINYNHCEGSFGFLFCFFNKWIHVLCHLPSVELPVKCICVFQKKASKRTFHSYYKAIFRVNILIDVVQCTWELTETWPCLRQSVQMEHWDRPRAGFLPRLYRKWPLVTTGTVTFSTPLSEE